VAVAWALVVLNISFVAVSIWPNEKATGGKQHSKKTTNSKQQTTNNKQQRLKSTQQQN
jgi:hypothetical protein